MRNINDFVLKNQDFKEIKKRYLYIKSNVKVYDYHKYLYKEWVKTIKERIEDKTYCPSELTVKDKDDIYKILTNIKVQEKIQQEYPDLNVDDLLKRLLHDYHEVSEYVSVTYKIEQLTEELNKLLDMITLEKIHDRFCINPNYLKIHDNNLMCLCCEGSTKDYNLSKDELEILIQSAKRKKTLIDDRIHYSQKLELKNKQ